MRKDLSTRFSSNDDQRHLLTIEHSAETIAQFVHVLNVFRVVIIPPLDSFFVQMKFFFPTAFGIAEIAAERIQFRDVIQPERAEVRAQCRAVFRDERFDQREI